jgi:putative nucleotidyltransferase with HDIG domain
METPRPLAPDASIKHGRVRSETLRNLSNLPPFHPTALRLLTISIDSDSAMARFEQCFRSDPALAADLLVLANSAEFGLRSRIDTIRHAVVVLGLERVRSLACGIAMRSYTGSTSRQRDLQPVWSHSVATAIIADKLGESARSAGKLLYTAALMHDVGRLGMLLGPGRKYAEMLAEPVHDVQEGVAQEMARFGMSHCEAGVVLARKWGLPASLQECISLHHDPVTAERGELLHLTQIACRLADSLGFGEVSHDAAHGAGSAEFLLPEPLRSRPELAADRLTGLVTTRISALSQQEPKTAK